jgi:hypothetical protein
MRQNGHRGQNDNGVHHNETRQEWRSSDKQPRNETDDAKTRSQEKWATCKGRNPSQSETCTQSKHEKTGADATKEQSALVTSSKPVRKACAIATNAKVEQDELQTSRYRTHEKVKVTGQRNKHGTQGRATCPCPEEDEKQAMRRS